MSSDVCMYDCMCVFMVILIYCEVEGVFLFDSKIYKSLHYLFTD